MYAVFLQGTMPTGQIAQVLVVPTSPARTFFRAYREGARGISARWEDWTNRRLDTIRDLPLINEPVAVKFTSADERQIAERGAPTTLGTKAQAASDKALRTSVLTFGDIIESGDLVAKVQSQDPSLALWFTDRRSSRVPTVAPSIRVSTSPMPQDVTPTAAPANSMPEMRMSMASVPDSSIASRYVHRQVYGTDDFAIFEYAQQTKANILVKGPTGAAKTMSALAYAASKGLPTFTISGSVNFEVSEAIGQLMINPDGSMYFQHGGAVEVIRDGGVLILDEINFIPGKVITPLFPLLDDRREIVLKQNKGEVIKAHPDLLIIATMNPGYLGTQQLNAALAHRFDIQLDWEYDDNVEKQLVPSKALRELAKQLREAEAGKRIFTPTPTNAIMEVVSLSKALGIDFAISNFLARYDESERASVNLFLETHRKNIEQDLGFAPAVSVETDEVAAPAVGEDEWERQLLDQSNASANPWTVTPATATGYNNPF